MITFKNIIKNKTIILLFILNLLDLILTYIGLQIGYLREENPIMKYFYEINPLLFIFIKFFIVNIGIYFTGYGFMKFKWVKYIITLPVITYATIVIIHFRYLYIVINIA